MKFLAMILGAALSYALVVISYSIIEAVWLNWIGDFALSLHEIVGIAGVLTALSFSAASQR